MGYSFKGRGILWHSETGPVKWWPINWFWMFVVNFEQERHRKLEEAAEAAKAADANAAAAKAADAKPGEAKPGEVEPVGTKPEPAASVAPEPPVETVSPAEAAAVTAIALGPLAEAIAPPPEAGSELAPPPPPEPEHLGGEPAKPAEPPKA
jgi:hypothetical protein